MDFHKKLKKSKKIHKNFFQKNPWNELNFIWWVFFGPGQHFLISWNFHRLYVIFIQVKLFDCMFMCSQISLQQFKIRFFFVIYHHDSCTILFEFRPFEVLYVVNDLTSYDNIRKILFFCYFYGPSNCIFWYNLLTHTIRNQPEKTWQ